MNLISAAASFCESKDCKSCNGRNQKLNNMLLIQENIIRNKMVYFGKILQNTLTSDLFFKKNQWSGRNLSKRISNHFFKYKSSVLSHQGHMVFPMISSSNQKQGKRVALLTPALCGWISSTW